MTATETLRPTPPTSVRTANAAIIGGGPCGLFAAISLAERGIPVTVFERNAGNTFVAARSYGVGITSRGRRALQTVDGLLEHIAKGGLEVSQFRLVKVLTDGTVETRGGILPSRKSNVQGLNVTITRRALVERLRAFVDGYEGVRIVDGRVKGVGVGDGVVEIEWEGGGGVQVMRSGLLLACDGRNSIVHGGLEGGGVRSRYGVGVREVDSASSGLLIKSFVVGEDEVERWVGMVGEAVDEDGCERALVNVRGERRGRRFGELFNSTIFPLNGVERRLVGGYLATVVRDVDHAVWKLKDVEDGFRLFEANFPQMRVRECISERHMQEFIDAKPLQFPRVARPKSLVVHVDARHASSNGKGQSGGVVFLGDAAHCFPPDAGQGVNSAFQDVQVLMQVIDAAGVDASIESVLKAYEDEREEDVEGLLRIVRFNNPYMHEQSRIGSFAVRLNMSLRRKLSQLFPGSIHPSISPLLVKGLSYREISRLVDTTTLRLYAAGGALLVATLGIVALVMR